ncbi:hypothetical protein BSKO_10257 [Bryopsis sp. KO-2023]|nr:hypothetical protein BSKO_10257 [Bryopsis sp. KO-2023]
MQKRWIALITLTSLGVFAFIMLKGASGRYAFESHVQNWKRPPQEKDVDQAPASQTSNQASSLTPGCVDFLNGYLKDNKNPEPKSGALDAESVVAEVMALEKQKSDIIVQKILSAMTQSKTKEQLKENMPEQGPTHFAYHQFSRTQKKMEACLGMESIEATQNCLNANKKRYSSIQFFDTTLLANINREIAPKSVLDMGSGNGGFLRGFFEGGAEKTAGVEISELGPIAYYTSGWEYESGPVQLPLFVPQGEPTVEALMCTMFGKEGAAFDMVWSAEVFEHIPREKHCEIMNFLAPKVGKFLVTSVAAMGQAGVGHVANRMRVDFKEDWESRGFVYDGELTKRVVKGGKISWYVNNIQVFRAPEDRQAVKAADCGSKENWLPYTDFDQKTVFFRNGKTLALTDWQKHPELARCFESQLRECKYIDGFDP